MNQVITGILKKLVADRYFPVNKTGNKIAHIQEAEQALISYIESVIGPMDEIGQFVSFANARNKLRTQPKATQEESSDE